MCEHTPVSAEDCKPNKSLRTTIKVFLRTEERKREALRLKETKATPPATPIEVKPAVVEAPVPDETPVEAPVSDEPTANEVKTEDVPETEKTEDAPSNQLDTEPLTEAQKDIPQQSIEVRTAPQPS